MGLIQTIKQLYWTVTETAAPANPDAGDQRLYIDPADHKLKRINSSGTVVTIEGGTMGGTTGSTDNAVLRADGTGGATIQSSLATVNDTGSVNIPTGQTYNINNSPHTHASSGTTVSESAYASPPSTPADGDLWLITDSFLKAHRVSSAWSYWYGTRHVIKPVAANFGTWFNQGSATLTDLGHLQLYTPAASGTNLRGVYAAATSNAFSAEAIMKCYKYGGANTGSQGMFVTDGTKAVVFGFAPGSGTVIPYLDVDLWNTSTGGVASAPYSVQWGGWTLADYIYMRIRETGGTRYFEASQDGVNYQTLYSHAVGTQLTTTGVGFCVETESTSFIASNNLLHWYQT